jgi:hypothetical protein
MDDESLLLDCSLLGHLLAFHSLLALLGEVALVVGVIVVFVVHVVKVLHQLIVIGFIHAITVAEVQVLVKVSLADELRIWGLRDVLGFNFTASMQLLLLYDLSLF